MVILSYLHTVKRPKKTKKLNIVKKFTEWGKLLNSKTNSSIFGEFREWESSLGYSIPRNSKRHHKVQCSRKTDHFEAGMYPQVLIFKPNKDLSPIWSRGNQCWPFPALFAPMEVLYGTRIGFRHHKMVQLANLHLVELTNSRLEH